MNEEQQANVKQIVSDLLAQLRVDMEKDSEHQRHQLTQLQTSLSSHMEKNKHKPRHDLQPDYFSGLSSQDPEQFLDIFERISQINVWDENIQLSAFPLYLKDIAHTWYLTLSAPDKGDLGRLKDAFRKRFVLGPHSWILNQQLAQRKQKPDESLDTYVTDITRLCRRLEIGDKDAMRYFIDGLHDDELKNYVLLQQPKTLLEAERAARLKYSVTKRSTPSNTAQNALTQLVTSLAQAPLTQSIAATTSAPKDDDKYQKLSDQVKQLQKQMQRVNSDTSVAAYQPVPTGPPAAASNFNGNYRPNNDRQLQQLQRQVSRLEGDLRRYQNPRRPDFRSFGRNFRSVEGQPICTFCSRVGHSWRTCRERNRDPRIPPRGTFPGQRALGPPPNSTPRFPSPSSRYQGNA